MLALRAEGRRTRARQAYSTGRTAPPRRAASIVSLSVLDDLRGAGPRSEDGGDAHLEERGAVALRNDAACDHGSRLQTVALERLNHRRHELAVRPGKNAEPHQLRAEVPRLLRDLVRRLSDARIRDVKTGLAQCTDDDPRAPVVTVEAGLRDENPERLLVAGGRLLWHCASYTAADGVTSSIRTPCVADGCVKAIRPRSPGRGPSAMGSPSACSASTFASTSPTVKAMWWIPSPRRSMNRPMSRVVAQGFEQFDVRFALLDERRPDAAFCVLEDLRCWRVEQLAELAQRLLDARHGDAHVIHRANRCPRTE